MEDRHAVVEDLSVSPVKLLSRPSSSSSPLAAGISSAAKSWKPSPKLSLFAVFDGHGGPYAADFAAKSLARHLVDACDALLARPCETLRSAFLSCDEEFVREHHTRSRTGTTALAVVLDAAACVLHIANAGDCRAVVCQGNTAVRLTQDHKPNDTVERDRIRKAGGIVGFDASEADLLNSPPSRVYTSKGVGGLSVARAIGDAFLKNVPGRPPVGNGSLITAEPDVACFPLTLPSADLTMNTALNASAHRFLIIACDGVWDVLSDQEAVDAVVCALAEHGDSAAPAQAACDALVALAFQCGSADNLTAIVVLFGSVPLGLQQSTKHCQAEPCIVST